MSDGIDREAVWSSASEASPRAGEQSAAVGAYEEGDDVVFYDTENPLAWVQTSETVYTDEMA